MEQKRLLPRQGCFFMVISCVDFSCGLRTEMRRTFWAGYWQTIFPRVRELIVFSEMPG